MAASDATQLQQLLRELLDARPDPSIVAVYMFGSVLHDPLMARDVDIVVVRDQDLVRAHEDVTAFSTELSTRFRAACGRELDQTRLFLTELEQTGFLNRVTAVHVWPQPR